jgi:hypothetical protein
MANFVGVSRGEDGNYEWNPWSSSMARLSIPGYYFGRSMIKAAEAFSQGRTYEGILNLGSFPINKDYFAKSGGMFEPDWESIGVPVR